MAYTADDLLTSARWRAAIPTAQTTATDARLLTLADEETLAYVLPLVTRVREDFGLWTFDYTIVLGNDYRIPYRAVGGALRDVVMLDASGNYVPIPRLDVEDVTTADFGYYVFGNVLRVLNKGNYTPATTLRLTYRLRPNRLILAANAGVVSSFNVSAKTVTLASAPAAFAGKTSFDLLRGVPGFEMLAFDAAGTISSNTITFSAALPADLAVNDYVTLPEQTPVPQVPAEFHPLLAQRVAVKYLESQGDSENLQNAGGILKRMEEDALVLVSPRVEGQPKKIRPPPGPWRKVWSY